MVRGALFATLAFAAVGSSFAVLDELQGYPAAGGQALRYAFGALLLLALLRGRLPRATPRQLGRLALLAATGLAGFNLLVLAAERSMDPASVGVVVGAVPLVLAVAGPLQAGRPIARGVLAGGALVALGAAVVQGVGGQVTALGLLAALGALAGEAAFSLLATPLLGALGPRGVSAWAAALAVPLLLVAGAVLDGPGEMLPVPTAGEALALLYLAVVVTAVAFVLWYSAVQRLGVERAGLFSGVLPVSALAGAALLGGAAVTPERLAGVLVVSLGLVVGLRGQRRSRAHRLGRPWRPPPVAPVPEGRHSGPGEAAGSRPLV